MGRSLVRGTGIRLTELAIIFLLALGVAVCLPIAAYAQVAEGGLQAADSGTALTAQATKYKVWVGGKQVTSANKNNVLGNGKVKYNPKTNTLTLKNAKIKGAYTHTVPNGGVYNTAISSHVDKGLTIVPKGKSMVTSTGSTAGGKGGFS